MTSTIGYRTALRTVIDEVDITGAPLWSGENLYGPGEGVVVESLKIRRHLDHDSVVFSVYVIGQYALKNGKAGKRRAEIYAGTRDYWPAWIAAIVDAHPVEPYQRRQGDINNI